MNFTPITKYVFCARLDISGDYANAVDLEDTVITSFSTLLYSYSVTHTHTHRDTHTHAWMKSCPQIWDMNSHDFIIMVFIGGDQNMRRNPANTCFSGQLRMLLKANRPRGDMNGLLVL